MAKLSGSQLAEARRRKQEAEEERQRQEEATARAARAAREAATKPLKERLAHLQNQQERRGQLTSVLKGLYDEMDKLSKKAPAEQITELAMRRVNDVIKRGKELLAGDEFIDSIEVFVAAGDRPEHRDALLVLRDLRQGIERLQAEVTSLRQRAAREKWNGEADEDEDNTDIFSNVFDR